MNVNIIAVLRRRVPFLFAIVLSCVAFTPQPSEAQAPNPEVLLTGSISKHSMEKWELLRFTLTFKNKTGVVLSAIRLDGPPDHYTFDQVCVLAVQQIKTCQTGEQFASNKYALAFSVSAGQSFTAWGYLKPISAHKSETLSLIVAWDFPKEVTNLPSSGVLSLGDNQVLKGYQAPWVDNLTKILAIPVILALISFFLNLLAKARDDRAATREREREAKLAAQEQDREEKRQQLQREDTVRTETWKQILPVSHTYALKFYLPLSSASERLADALVKPNLELAFYYVLFAGKRMTETRNEVGGFYFKDLRGEALASACWKKQRDLLLGPEDSQFSLSVRAAIDLLHPNETYESFQKRFKNGTDASAAFTNDEVLQSWKLFLEWKKSDKAGEVVRYLKAFYAILDYETNRPYEYWYNPPARLHVDREIEALLREVGEQIEYTKEQMAQYFESALRLRNPA